MEKETAGLWEMIRSQGKKNGRPVRFYSAYPLIGRGNVIHGVMTHEEIESRFQKALRVPFSQRLKNTINGWFCR